ncbi:MAG: hypothetical protein LDL16_01740 [Thiobacillus sp.]|nr:hypothetical protein [Thiobacillus sp.]
MKMLDKENHEWESGWWKISPDTAEQLVGGEIYFHKARAKPSFFGGLILSYRVETEGEWPGRILFRFRTGNEFKGVEAGMDGWGMEKKIVI